MFGVVDRMRGFPFKYFAPKMSFKIDDIEYPSRNLLINTSMWLAMYLRFILKIGSLKFNKILKILTKKVFLLLNRFPPQVYTNEKNK